MQTLQQSYKAIYISERKQSLSTRFILWCKSQEKYRLGWLAVIIASHGCFLTPVTLLAIISAGNSMFFWSMAIAAMGMTLLTNLAALPTKITIPIFLLSIIIDLVIIANCIAIGFNISATYV
jgi:hypothetical protein